MADEIVKDQEQKEEKVLEEQKEEIVFEEQKEDGVIDKKDKKINKYKEQLAQRDKEIFQLKDQLMRNQAELENFKKRIQNERIIERKFASKDLIYDLLVPLDMLKTIVNNPTEDEKLKNYLIGFKMLNDQIFQVLESDGLKEIEALNKQFDPNFHHAVEKISDKDKANGINLEVIQKGYTYKEQLLRPAVVKINEWSDEYGKN
ncbi:MAG: nucleotide exchange factor GrpE [Acholeplasmataceae bacterium]